MVIIMTHQTMITKNNMDMSHSSYPKNGKLGCKFYMMGVPHPDVTSHGSRLCHLDDICMLILTIVYVFAPVLSNQDINPYHEACEYPNDKSRMYHRCTLTPAELLCHDNVSIVIRINWRCVLNRHIQAIQSVLCYNGVVILSQPVISFETRHEISMFITAPISIKQGRYIFLLLYRYLHKLCLEYSTLKRQIYVRYSAPCMQPDYHYIDVLQLPICSNSTASHRNVWEPWSAETLPMVAAVSSCSPTRDLDNGDHSNPWNVRQTPLTSSIRVSHTDMFSMVYRWYNMMESDCLFDVFQSQTCSGNAGTSMTSPEAGCAETCPTSAAARAKISHQNVCGSTTWSVWLSPGTLLTGVIPASCVDLSYVPAKYCCIVIQMPPDSPICRPGRVISSDIVCMTSYTPVPILPMCCTSWDMECFDMLCPVIISMTTYVISNDSMVLTVLNDTGKLSSSGPSAAAQISRFTIIDDKLTQHIAYNLWIRISKIAVSSLCRTLVQDYMCTLDKVLVTGIFVYKMIDVPEYMHLPCVRCQIIDETMYLESGCLDNYIRFTKSKVQLLTDEMFYILQYVYASKDDPGTTDLTMHITPNVQRSNKWTTKTALASPNSDPYDKSTGRHPQPNNMAADLWRVYGNPNSIGFAWMSCMYVLSDGPNVPRTIRFCISHECRGDIQDIYAKQISSVRMPKRSMLCDDMLYVKSNSGSPECEVVILYLSLLWPRSQAL